MIESRCVVAGGMTAGRGVPIGQRPVLLGPESESLSRREVTASSSSSSPGPGQPARSVHAWFRDPISGERYPALIVEQARGPEGAWVVSIVHVATDERGATCTVHGWVDAASIEPMASS